MSKIELPAYELASPSWRNGSAYASALDNETVSSEIKTAILNNPRPKLPRRTDSECCDELNQYYPELVSQLRLHDLGNPAYWYCMLGISFLFLCCELVFVRTAATDAKHIIHFQSAIIVCMIGLVLFLCLYSYAAYRLHVYNCMPRYLDRVPRDLFHTAPVVWVSLYTVGLNYYIVSQTGFYNSPFLHALLASALVIISLPRENSKLVISVSLIAFCLGLFGSLHTTYEFNSISDWGGEELAHKLIMLTFIFSAVTAIVLRVIANYKINQLT